MKHKWYKEIVAWADGKIIQERYLSKSPSNEPWITTCHPQWIIGVEYRIKPDSLNEPIRANVKIYKKGAYSIMSIEKVSDEKVVSNAGKLVQLIEAGYCQMIKHDRSDKCPVDVDTEVIYGLRVIGPITVSKAGAVAWEYVTHYAIILPMEKAK